jgi:hypothetical protein
MQRKMGEWTARRADGRTVRVILYRDVLDGGILGLGDLTTDQGETLNQRGKGRYEVVATGEIIQSSDPDAP